MLRWIFALVIATAAAWTGASAAPAVAPQPASVQGAVPFALRVERRARNHTFAELRGFGDLAARRNDRESLRRLQHVVTVLRSQSEFDMATKYNAELARSALGQQDTRYVGVAVLNSLAQRYDQGDASVVPRIKSFQTSGADWFVRTYAKTLWARVLVDQRNTGAALKLLSGAEQQIPMGDAAAADADAKAAEASIWEIIGLALMGLHDLEGSAHAFERAQFEFTDPAYPRPDFDAIYNLAHMAIDLGRQADAKMLVAANRELTQGTDLPHLAAWDANLCGIYAEAFGKAADVMTCFKDLDGKLSGAEFLARSLLPMRAIAEAQLGQIDMAQADLDRLRAMAAKAALAGDGGLGFVRIREVEAEMMLARGDARGAYGWLRDYAREQRFQRAEEVYGGVRQVTGALQMQLETARHETELEGRAVQAQRGVIVLGVLLGLGAAILVALQLRGAGRLRAAQKRAEEANAAKSTFLATMSHEIRTPLNGVLGMAQAMAAETLGAKQRERLTVIRESGEALLAILNDVLDLSKIEAGKLELELVEFRLTELARGAYSAFTAIANKKGLSFALEVDAAKGRYIGDPTRLRQVLYNLISNALKFTEHGEIRVTAAYVGGVLEIAVADTGVGIAPANRSKLFAKFDQLDSSTTRRFGGTGLGLSICQDLADLMDGDILVESELGRGSRFTFRVPLERVGDEVGLAPAPVQTEDAEPMALRVLAAEDNAVNQLVLKTLLHQVGIDPHVVDNGEAAVTAWETGDWDVILMDIQMPGMDGLTATSLIRARERATGRRRTPIIALTANAMAHQVQQYLAVGMDDHVSKPIEAPALYATLMRASAEAQDPGSEAKVA